MSEAPVGTHVPAGPTDLRTPCPILNSLANSGYLPRSGRNVTQSQLRAGLKQIGVGPDVAEVLIRAAFRVHVAEPRNFGLREEGQENEKGEPVINLDQVGRPHAIEHDVSMSRQDRELGNPVPVHPPSVHQLLAFPGTSAENMSLTEWGKYRKARYEQSKATNPKLEYGAQQQFFGNAEAAAFAGIFGKGLGYNTPLAYIKAMFEEDRLPVKEGWKPRWLPLLLPETLLLVGIVGRFSKP